MTDDLAPDDRVWVVPSAGSYVIHTTPDCQTIKAARADPRPKRRAEVPNHEVCEHCLGAVDHTPEGPDSVLDPPQEAVVSALREADGPLSARDLKFDAHLSRRRVERALRELRTADRVEMVHPPGTDHRRPYYRLVGSQPVEVSADV